MAETPHRRLALPRDRATAATGLQLAKKARKKEVVGLTCDFLFVDQLTKHQGAWGGTRLRRSDRGLRAPCTRRFPRWEHVLGFDFVSLPWPVEPLQGSRHGQVVAQLDIFAFEYIYLRF